MRVEPLAHVALVRLACASASSAAVERAAGGQRAIQAEPVADDHQRRERGGAEVDDGAAEQAR